MKKYFAKLVPVEGKLNSGWDGTLVRDTKGKYGDFILTHDIRAVMTVEEAESRLQQIKLFLCSRDIQVGDKVMHHMVYQDNRIEDFEVTRVPENGSFIEGINLSINNGKFIYLPNPFKAIGEISPEATWVKEGDEFDEEEIYRTETEMEYDPETEEIECYTNRILGTAPTKEGEMWSYAPIKILGPCKHFH